MLNGDTKLKLEDAYRDKKKVHYALQFGKTQHVICIYPQHIPGGVPGISCKIMKCECIKDNDNNDIASRITLTPKAAEAPRSRAYRCDYYSNTHILLKRSQIVYTCGCSTGMYNILEERLKNAMEEN